MQPKHSAIVAGLTLALSFGAVSVPAPAAAEELLIQPDASAQKGPFIEYAPVTIRVSIPSSPSRAC